MSLLLSQGSAPEVITVDKWYRQGLYPIRRASSVAAIASSLFFTPVVSTPFDWNTTQVNNAKRAYVVRSGESRVDLVAAPEVITVDKWFANPSYPYFQKRNVPLSGEFRPEVPRTVLLTDWLGNQNYPNKTTVLPKAIGESRVDIVTPPEVVTVDKWYEQGLYPIVRVRKVNGSGEFSGVTPRDILISDWFTGNSFPIKQLRSNNQSGETRVEVITPPADVTIEWFVQNLVPYFRLMGINGSRADIDFTEIIPPIPPTPPEPTPDTHDGFNRPDERKKRIVQDDEQILLMIAKVLFNARNH